MVLNSDSYKDTLFIAQTLGNFLKEKDVVLFSGELGAGKTTFIKGICKAKGVNFNRVNSPSFVILNIYEGKIKIFHFDFFRLDTYQILDLGIYDYLEENALFLIEWSCKIKEFLERKDIEVELEYLDLNRRKITFRYFSKRGKNILEGFKRALK